MSPIVSEFETQEQADSYDRYDRWFRARVEAAINSTKPRIPHDQVMTEIRSRLEAKRKLHNAS
ncbi:antitoxin [Serratia sp. S1B]|nr:antitoxin [Serratia sp. S1B]